MMTEEAKCLKIKAHFGETRGPISTESVRAAPLVAHGVRRIRLKEKSAVLNKLTFFPILFEHSATRLLISNWCKCRKSKGFPRETSVFNAVRVTFEGALHMLAR